MATNIYMTPSFLETQRKQMLSEGIHEEDANRHIATFIASKVPEFNEKFSFHQQNNGNRGLAQLLDYTVYGTTKPVERFSTESEEDQLTEMNFDNPADPRNRQFNPLVQIGEKVKNAFYEGVEREGQAVRESAQRETRGGLGTSFQDRRDALMQGRTLQDDGSATSMDTVATAVSGAGQVAGEIAFAGIGGVASAATPDFIEEPVKERFMKGMEWLASGEEGLPQLAKPVLSLFEKYERLKETDPTAAQRIDSALGITEMVTAFAGAPLVQRSAAKAVKSVDEAAGASVKSVKNASSKFNRVVDEGMNAVRPTVRGKKSASDIKDYSQKANTAVRSIIERKDSLRLVDEFGEEIEGLPQNLRQFSESIEQTREMVFREYDELAKQAGTAGAEVNLQRVAGELIDAVSDPKFLSLEDQSPQVADYLLKRATALERRGKYTTEQAQQAIKNYNQSLNSFYNNPTYESYANAAIDAMIANNLRKSLDDVIGEATGAQYQALKNQYAALKTIESDVVKRAIVDARKNTKGLIDFTDILSGGELVAGLVSTNPALIGKAAVQKGIKEYFKFLNDPNRAIKSMFKRGEAILNSIPPESI